MSINNLLFNSISQIQTGSVASPKKQINLKSNDFQSCPVDSFSKQTNSINAQKQVSFGENKFSKNSTQCPDMKDEFHKLWIMMPPIVRYKEMIVPVFNINRWGGKMKIQGTYETVKSGDIDLKCFFVPPQKGKPTVLWCHGNGESVEHTQIIAKQLAAKGNGVMMVEYEGYGNSPGKASEQKLYQNAIDAAKYLNEKKNIPNSQIFVMGHSLGGPIAAHTAASAKEGSHFAGVILDSTVPSMPDLVKSYIDHNYLAKAEEPKKNYTLSRIRRDLDPKNGGGGLYETKEFIKQVPKSTEVFVINSVNDDIVDQTVGQKTMNAVRAVRPDAGVYWETKSSRSHLNYKARMPKIIEFIDSAYKPEK